MRELVSKVEGGCMSVCFHMASRDFAGFWRELTCFGDGLTGFSTGFLTGVDRILEGNLTRLRGSLQADWGLGLGSRTGSEGV